VRQLVVFQSRPVSRLRYTQLGVLARPLTRTRTPPPGGGGASSVRSEEWAQGARPLHGRHIHMQSGASEEAGEGRQTAVFGGVRRQGGLTPYYLSSERAT
jgi:hypothetical protein